MGNIFYRITKANCQEINFSLNENGLLEFTIPKNCTNEEVLMYFYGFGAEERNKIADNQKKAKGAFRKKVQKMIDEYKKEFNLDLYIKLRLPNNTKKLNDCNVQIYGIVFEGNLSIISILQYFPDELVEKIIRCTVYMMACEYEERYSRIKGMSVGILEPSDGEGKNERYKIPEEAKYHIPVPDSEIEKIKADYEAACNQFSEDLDKRPISSI